MTLWTITSVNMFKLFIDDLSDHDTVDDHFCEYV